MNKLSANQIFTKTIKYVVLRMVVPIVSAIVALAALKVITGIVTGGDETKKLGWISTLIWLVITCAVHFFLNFFIGFKFRAGHMAVITDAVSAGVIPAEMSKVAKETTASRFPSGNEYLYYRRAVMGSLNQLQLQLNTFAENRLRVPVLGQLIRLAQFLIGHALSFTYDLVLCYTFWRDGKSLYASAADGIAVYWDSWRRMFHNVFLIAIEIIIGMATGFGFVAVIVAVVFAPASGPLAAGLAGIAVGYFICSAAKVVLDTNLTLKTLDAYFEEAQYADYNVEQYENMCQYSKAYDKLYRKACNEAFEAPAQTYDENYDYAEDFDYTNYDYSSENYGDDYGESYGDADFANSFYNDGYADDYSYAGYSDNYADGYSDGYSEGYDQSGYDANAYGADGYDQNGYDPNAYGADGYDQNGYDQGGYDQGGYDQGQYGTNDFEGSFADDFNNAGGGYGNY